MVFPVAIGSKSISLLSFSPINKTVDPKDDEEEKYAVYSEHSPSLCSFSSCPENELQAVVTTLCGYMVCRNTETKQDRFVEIRVRVSPLSQQLSKSAHRESVFRLYLETTQERNGERSTSNINSAPPLQTLFSPDRRFLTCLVPLDDCQESIVVIFQLRVPRKKSGKPPPPIPTYIHAPIVGSEVLTEIPVAAAPRLLRVANNKENSLTFRKATCLCNLRTPYEGFSKSGYDDESSLLLLGCSDGSVMAVSYRRASVIGRFIDFASFDTHLNPVGLKCMDQVTTPELAKKQKGRLCTIDVDGNLRVFDVEFHLCQKSDEAHKFLLPQNNSNTDVTEDHLTSPDPFVLIDTSDGCWFLQVTQRRLQFSFSESGCITFATWMAKSNLLAVLFQSGNQSTLYVLLCNDQDFDDVMSPLLLRVLSQLSINKQYVKESAHSQLVFEASVNHNRYDQRTHSLATRVSHVTYIRPIQYEPTIQCFFINDAGANEAYALLWHWKSNTQGLSIYKTASNAQHDSCPDHYLYSCLQLARDKQNKIMVLADVTLFLHGELSVTQFIRKDLYELGILSPACERRSPNNAFFDHNSPVFLTAKTVAYPRMKKRAIRDDYELEWTEACLPSHIRYPCMSAFGRRWGRSIAIACDVGLCVVDVAEKSTSLFDTKNRFWTSERSASSFVVSRETLADIDKVSEKNCAVSIQRRAWPRWYLLGSDLIAQNFQVVCFSWWEDSEETVSVHDRLSDDILVTVLKIQNESNIFSYFLSCWSKSKLDLSHQLLADCNGASCSSPWGLKLAQDFIPSKLSVFGQPLVSKEESRKSYVLLTTDNESTEYLCFQLQVISAESKRGNKLDTPPYRVLGELVGEGSIGGPGDIFIAGASFDFHLGAKKPRASSDPHLVTIGVAREFGAGLDAMALSRNGVSLVGEIVPSNCTDARSSSVSSISQSWSIFSTAAATSRPVTVWIIHLLDDKIVTWIVPSWNSEEGDCDSELCFEATESNILKDTFLSPVHTSSSKLGWSAFSGKASDWMQVPVATTSTEITLGPLQLGPADCMIAVTQQSHKLHRSFDDRHESLLFRCDFLRNEIFAPSAFRVKPPGLLPTLNSVASQTIAADVWNQTTILQEYPVRVFEQSTSHEAFMLAIQVFFLRVLENLNNNETFTLDPKQCLLQRLLATSVDSARMASSPLHFSMFFLEVGRQVEPGNFGKLFPLPSSSWMLGHEEVLDLLEMALDQGALDVATATLPMLTSQQNTLRYCYHILRELLHKLARGNGMRPMMGSRLRHEMSLIGDLFRYALKIGSDAVAHDTFANESKEDEEIKRQSALCFLPNIFYRGKGEAKIGEAAATFIISGFDEDSTTSWACSSNNENYLYSATLGSCHDVARCTVDTLIEAVLPASSESNWRLGALTARLLLGMDNGGTKLTTKSRIGRGLSTITCLSSLESEIGNAFYFLRREYLECAKQIKPSAASAIADLAVLSCDNLHETQAIPDKIVPILLVCLHCSNRSQELLDCLDKDKPNPFSQLVAQLYS
jgi:hypothetical protein